MKKKSSLVSLFSLLISALSLNLGLKAEETARCLAPTSVQADLMALNEKIMAKIRGKQTTAAALEPEFAMFKALAVKYRGEPEATAEILVNRANLTLRVLHEEVTAKALYKTVLNNYPGTKQASYAKQQLHFLSPGGKTETKAKPSALMNRLAPDFEVRRFEDDRKVKLSDYRGKIVVLDFWASWCGPCRAAMPYNQKIAAAYKDQDVIVFAVCVWDTKGRADVWLKENKSKYANLYWAYDLAGNSDKSLVTKLYGVNGVPAQFIIDRDGKLIDSTIGYVDGDNILEAALSKAGVKVAPALVGKRRGGPKK